VTIPQFRVLVLLDPRTAEGGLRQRISAAFTKNSVVAGMREWDDEMESQAMLSYPDGVNPRRVYHELNKRLPANAIVTADAGTTADWYGHHIRLRRGMMGDLSGRLASMLAAMPYAVAAKFAYSDRTVICTIGDGAFQMLE
jgi:pyruvate dehydrogenase (quinone)